MKKMSALLGAAVLFGGLGFGNSTEPDPFGPVVPKKRPPEPDPLFNREDPWVPFNSINLDDPEIVRVRIDTRDYHCVTFKTREKYPDTHKARKTPQYYFHTTEEVKNLFARYFDESSYGDPEENNHVHLALDGVFRSMHGEMKYTELIRVPQGLWAVCTGDDKYFMFHKADLAQPVFYGKRSKA